MSIPTSRAKEAAEIRIIPEKCNGCGLCVEICSDFDLIMENGKAKVSEKGLFGCIGCGQCMAICPTDAIEIWGRNLTPEDLFDLPDKSQAADYEQILALLQRRRSIRDFKDKIVETEIIEKILAAARTAPMGIPPSDVNILIFDSREKSFTFVKDFCEYLKGMKWFFSKWFMNLMRPFWGKETADLFKSFLIPLYKIYTESMDKGINYVTYDAPLTMYFYGSPYTDPADSIIAATYAMTAAESLGLGTCMLGGIHPFIQKGKSAEKFRKKWGIKFKSQEGLFVIFGYPKYKFHKGIKRTFANENYN
jgi:ferredoxin